jgi:hypothetical protein
MSVESAEQQQDAEDAIEARPPSLLLRLEAWLVRPADLDRCVAQLAGYVMPQDVFERRMRARMAAPPSKAPLVTDAATLWLCASLAARGKTLAAAKHARRLHMMPRPSSQACAVAADGLAVLTSDVARSAQLLNQAFAALSTLHGPPRRFVDGARRLAWQRAGYPFESLPGSEPVVDAALTVLFGHT